MKVQSAVLSMAAMAVGFGAITGACSTASNPGTTTGGSPPVGPPPPAAPAGAPPPIHRFRWQRGRGRDVQQRDGLRRRRGRNLDGGLFVPHREWEPRRSRRRG